MVKNGCHSAIKYGLLPLPDISLWLYNHTSKSQHTPEMKFPNLSWWFDFEISLSFSFLIYKCWVAPFWRAFFKCLLVCMKPIKWKAKSFCQFIASYWLWNVQLGILRTKITLRMRPQGKGDLKTSCKGAHPNSCWIWIKKMLLVIKG